MRADKLLTGTIFLFVTDPCRLT